MHPSPASEPGHYHLSVHTVSKLKGNSVLAMAAYRHAELFRANSVTHAAAYQRAQELGNDGKVFDYRRKIGVAWTAIMAPEFTPNELLDAQSQEHGGPSWRSGAVRVGPQALWPAGVLAHRH